MAVEDDFIQMGCEIQTRVISKPDSPDVYRLKVNYGKLCICIAWTDHQLLLDEAYQWLSDHLVAYQSLNLIPGD